MHRVKCNEHLPDRGRWNERHGASLARQVGAGGPASVLRQHEALLCEQPRGPALDVACGLGRNALHLAELGFSVVAVDVSDVALDEVSRRAVHCAMPVRAVRADLRHEQLPGSAYQVIVDTYFLDRSLLGQLVEALAPGGLLLFETFLALKGETGPPQDPYVLARGELQETFAELELVSYSEEEPEGDRYPIARFVGRRRPAGLDSRTP